MSKLLIIIAAALFISACTPEPKQDPYHPYECFNLEQPESEWRCTFNGEHLDDGEQHTMNLNIKNGKKVKQNG
ncbi:hypothetical protein [Aeromonas rivipollensis]|uniref:hypothetical protein n=1 Tax=Aeromonas rivipollensis TaxID=948519 RepID=UPI0013D19ECD|nr:hypothetical protein [Aeromonas rivipollensis]NEX81745.1 hypothetical protein [Aeromonas rivipollensis]